MDRAAEKLELDLPGDPRAGLCTMARDLIGSEILRIASEIRTAKARGETICDLTVGDFSSKEFPIPDKLREGVVRALAAGETNYPPSDGVLRLREAVREFYHRGLSLDVPLESVLIGGGSRPLIFATYAALVDRGDVVVYPVPSWNNNHYCHLVGAKGIAIATDPEHGFLPTAELLEPHLESARLVALNTPLNPAGTVLEAQTLRRICEAVVSENDRRAHLGHKPLYVLYDQVYWMLTFGEAKHETPVHLVPRMAPYTVFIDGISKAFAATGLRVGWSVGPRAVIAAMKDLLGHIGRRAPAGGPGRPRGVRPRGAGVVTLRSSAPREPAGPPGPPSRRAVRDGRGRIAGAGHSSPGSHLPFRPIRPDRAPRISHERRRPPLPASRGRPRAGAVPGLRPRWRKRMVPL